jgi:non-ribosomal peptide synthetase component E (peptide arylation enzyme)
MILGNGAGPAGAQSATLDELFRRAGVRHPQAIALIDPPNRERFTDGAPRALSYAEADGLISAFAARLRGLDLRTDAVVAIQLPNTVEGVIALMGVLRAGMIAALLPLLWREQDIVEALRRTGAKAIVTCARAGQHAPVQAAMQAAAALFPIRHICGFGRGLPDGVMPLDDLYAQTPIDFVPGPPRLGTAADHVAVLTFDVTADGVVPLARSHAQLLGGALAPFLETDLAPGAALLCTIPSASFAGLALGVVPWLLCGGTLALHQGCDPMVLAAQCGTLTEATMILPGPALAPLSDAALLNASLKTIVALWRAPERLASCARWHGEAALVDAAAFGEIGLLACRRGEGGMLIPCGPIRAARGAAGAVTVAETARSKTGTLALRGPMVPAQAFPPGATQSDAVAPDPAGFVDTGFACRRDGDALTITGPPAGIAAIGGYRFRKPALEAQVAAIDPAATILAVPDRTIGERLAGAAADPRAVRAALQAGGANPLVSAAFRPRGEADAA